MLSLLKVKFSISGLGAQQKQLRVPRLRYDGIAMGTEDWSVVDAGTASGENFQGTVDKIKLGEGANLPVYVERNELSMLIDAMVKGISAGHVYDADLAADNDPVVDDITRRRWFNLTGPFQLRGMSNPVLDVSLRAITDEFGGASAYSATLVVLLKVSTKKNQNKPGVYWHREYRTTDTRHEMPLGPSLVTEVFLFGATGRTVPRPYLSKVQLPAEANGRASTDKMDVDIDITSTLESEYMSFKTAAAPVAERYRISNIRSNFYPSRQIVADANTTTTLLMFAKNVVG